MIEVVLNENLNSDALTKLIRGDHGSILKKLVRQQKQTQPNQTVLV